VTVAVLFFGAKAVIDGNLSVGQLVAFNMLANRVTQPVLRLAQNWQDFQQARISVERLGDILNSPPEPTFTPGRTALPAIKGSVSFEHMTFRYRLDGPAVLHDINLDIPVGQSLGSLAARAPGNRP
jgi:ATP-binding cassette, subfamily B, bacterial HlyB/CyaB